MDIAVSRSRRQYSAARAKASEGNSSITSVATTCDIRSVMKVIVAAAANHADR